jgi:hypothetical protein
MTTAIVPQIECEQTEPLQSPETRLGVICASALENVITVATKFFIGVSQWGGGGGGGVWRNKVLF